MPDFPHSVANLTNADGSAAFDVRDTVLINSETVLVTGIDTANKALIVRRGYVRPASAHAAGTRIAARLHRSLTWQSALKSASSLIKEAALELLLLSAAQSYQMLA
jgi:hypothetical protein